VQHKPPGDIAQKWVNTPKGKKHGAMTLEKEETWFQQGNAFHQERLKGQESAKIDETPRI
jgi:hypothetical protein